MADSRIFRLVHRDAREGAARFAMEAPVGWVAKYSPPARTLDQNALLWPLLECFSDQLEWPVNGRMCKLSPEEWKDILSASFKREMQRVSPGLDGGMVLLGLRTSKMNKAEFSEFIEFVLATAADRGVEVERETA